MQDIEPPEAPVDLVPMEAISLSGPKKDSFLKKLFSRKAKDTVVAELPPLELSLPENDIGSMPQLQDDVSMLPPLDDQLIVDAPTKAKNKSMGKKGKDKKTDYSRFDESDKFDWSTPVVEQEYAIQDAIKSSGVRLDNKTKGKKKKGTKIRNSQFDEKNNFNWTRPIQDQEILIHDSNRSNQDIGALIDKADAHIAEKEQSVDSNGFMTEQDNITTDIEQVEIPQTHDELNNMLNPVETIVQENIVEEMPMLGSEEQKTFKKINMSHQKIRNMLEKNLKDKKFLDDKTKVVGLLRAYDESIERKIEEKETQLSQRHKKLETLGRQLHAKESGTKKLFTHLKIVDNMLRVRESKINEIISQTVEKELARRTKTEKKLLKKEIAVTVRLNRDLKSKTKSIEKSRIQIDEKYKKIMETERKKFNDLQEVYDKKLSELERDSKEFENRRSMAIDLLGKADTISKELENVKHMKAFVEQNRKVFKRELTEDRELKRAIDKGEMTLRREKENLDNIVFSKYIEKKLRTIRPTNADSKQELKISLESNPLYDTIKQCRQVLEEGNTVGAKDIYNKIKRSFEHTKLLKKEHDALYTAIRELYTDIQLKTVEIEMQ